MTVLLDPQWPDGCRCSDAEWKEWREYITNLERDGGDDARRADALNHVRGLLEDAETLARVVLGDRLTADVVVQIAGLIAARERERVTLERNASPQTTSTMAAEPAAEVTQ